MKKRKQPPITTISTENGALSYAGEIRFDGDSGATVYVLNASQVKAAARGLFKDGEIVDVLITRRVK